MPRETQKSIAEWAENTFGTVPHHSALVTRAQIEMAELLDAVNSGNKDEIAAESADVIILLMRLAELSDFSLSDALDKKMKTNRSRTWISKGDGTGKHVK